MDSNSELISVIYLKARRKARRKARARSRKKSKPEPLVPQTHKKDDAAVKERSHSRRLKTVLIFVVPALILFTACFVWLNWPFASQQPEPQTNVNVPKAAILDGLYNIDPNLTLTERLTNILVDAGYRVDLFRGENVTIGLMENIGGYEVLILRLHSAIHTDRFLYLFSGELYAESKYVNEQLSGAVRKGYTFTEGEPPYFALNAAFLGNNKPDGLSGSTIILTGCNGTGEPYVIERLFERGAKTYISWNGYVDLHHSDEATLSLVRALYSERLGLKEAVEKVTKEVGADPFYNSTLEYRTH
jgi:hypothetical protein